MSAASLQELFASGTPFRATLPIKTQATAATVLLLTAAAGSAAFSVSNNARKALLILPVSIFWAFGFLYLLCAAGVYV